MAITAGPVTPDVAVTLSGGKTIQAKVIVDNDTADVLRFSPTLAEGAFWSFGDTFQRAIYYSCTQQKTPLVVNNTLTCPKGSEPIIRPDVTLPESPGDHPNSNIPPVTPGGRPVMQSAHVFQPWLVPVAAIFIALVFLCLWLRRRSNSLPMPPVADEQPDLSRTAWILMGLLTLVGALLRLATLHHEPFEQNEFTYFISGMGHNSVMGVLLDVNGLAQTHPPLYHLLLYGFSGLGNSEAIARLPAALAGITSIPLLFLLAWRYFSGRVWPATFAGAMLTVSPVHVWYSQDVSPYTFTTLFAIITMLGFHGALRNATQSLNWWAIIVGSWGMFYTHYYGIHLSLACYAVLFYVVSRKGQGWQGLANKTLWSGFVISTGVIVWLPAFIQAYEWSKGHSTAYQRLAGVYHEHTDRIGDVIDVWRLIAGFPDDWRFMSLFLIVPMALLWKQRLKQSRRAQSLLWAPLLWFTGFELINRETFLNDLYGGWYFGIRYGLFLFPVAFIIAAQWVGTSRLARMTAVSGVIVGLYTTTTALLSPNKPDVATATQLIKNNIQPGDALVVGPAAFYQHPVHYYMGTKDQREQMTVNDYMQTPRWKNGAVGILSDVFEPYEQSFKNQFINRIWLIEHTQHLFGRREFSDRPQNAMNTIIETQFNERWQKSFHDVTVRLLERTRQTAPQVDRLHFGWSDGPYVKGFEPPWAYASPGRRVRPGAEIKIPVDRERTLESIVIRAGTMPPGGHQAIDEKAPTSAILNVRLNGKTTELRLTETFSSHRIPVTGQQEILHITLGLQPPEKGAPRPPEIIMDRLSMDYRNDQK